MLMVEIYSSIFAFHFQTSWKLFRHGVHVVLEHSHIGFVEIGERHLIWHNKDEIM